MIRSSRSLELVLSLLLLLFVSPLAAQVAAEQAADLPADEIEGRARFEAGRAAFAAGRFDDALDDFQRAHRLTKNPILLFNIGAAADRLRKDELTLEAFAAYLAQVPEAPNRAEVEGRVRLLTERSSPRAAKEAEPQSETAATPTPAAEVETAGSEAAMPPLPNVASPATDSPRSITRSPWPWLLAGAGAALVVSGAVVLALGVKDKSKVEHAERDTQWSSVSDARDRAPTRIGLGAACLGIGLVSTAAGLIWHFRKSRVTPGIEVGAQSMRFALAGSF